MSQLEGLWGNGMFGICFLQSNVNVAAFGTLKVSPPDSEQQQQLFDGEGDLLLLVYVFKCYEKSSDLMISILLRIFE